MRAWVRDYSLLAASLLAVIAGLSALALQAPALSRWIFAGSTGLVLLVTAVSTARSLARRELGVDVIALLAMAGALLLGEFLAGAIIAVMLTGGAALERYAIARARRELSALVSRAPRIVHRRAGSYLIDITIEEVALGDVLLVKPGEVVPVDGILVAGSAMLDESALTGESKPVQLEAGMPMRSGGSNGGGPFELRATARAGDSTYAGIIRLVRAAEQSKAPFVRLADRYAVAFLGLTLTVAGLAWWIEGSALRALTVLVVATPCPLILAAPAAIIAGVSRAARQGIIIKGGGPLETLARVRILLLDKTGTVTMARPEVVAVETLAALPSD